MFFLNAYIYIKENNLKRIQKNNEKFIIRKHVAFRNQKFI